MKPFGAWHALVQRSRLQILTTCFLVLIAWLGWNWCETVKTLVGCYNPLPVFDYWRVVLDMVALKTTGVKCLWRQHNEHRILCQEIVFLADMMLLRGRMILPLATSFLCYFCTWIALGWAVCSDPFLPRSIRWVAILLAGIIIGWKGSVAVLGTPFQLQWTLTELAAVLAFAFLARSFATGGDVYLGLAIFCAAVTTYSSSNGLLLWPLLIVAALLLRFSRGRLIVLIAAAIVFDGLYFVGYQFGSSMHIGALLLHPIYSAEWIGAFLSMPFGGRKTPEFAAYLGMGSIVAVVILGAFAVRKRIIASETGIVLFGLWAFTIATALMTAAGRMSIDDAAFVGARPSRYLIAPTVDWAVVALLCLWISSRLRWRWISAPLLAVVFSALLALAFPKLRWWREDIEDQFAKEQLAALSIEDGLADPMMIRTIFPDPGLVFRYLDFLRVNHLCVFAGHHYQWLGRPVSAFAAKQPGFASAQIAEWFPLQGGLEMAGWLDDSERAHRSQWILLANEKDEIVGFARKLPAGFPRHLRAPNLPYSLGWAGFANARFTAQRYSAYVIQRAGLIPLAGSFPAPTVSSTGAQERGPTLTGIEWQMDPSWTLNGLPAVDSYHTPVPGRIYSSWSGDDRHTGQIVSSIFQTPANGCFILPVLTGPEKDGESVEVQDADSGEMVARAPMQNDVWVWSFWRFSLPDATKHVRIVGRDEGNAWGEWVALADPAECR